MRNIIGVLLILAGSLLAQPATDSMALMAEASRLYQAGQFAKAAVPYQKALDLEKQQRKLTPVLWRVLVDNLAMSYGIPGNDKAAEEVLQYGISQDPSYPMFYYIMANVYGERKDLDNTLKYLRLALQNKGNMNAGETVPNPMTDDSFKSFVKNSDFKKLAAQFK